MFTKITLFAFLFSALSFTTNCYSATQKIITYPVNKYVYLGHTISLLTPDGINITDGNIVDPGEIFNSDMAFYRWKLLGVRVTTKPSQQSESSVVEFFLNIGVVQLGSATIYHGQRATMNVWPSELKNYPVFLSTNGAYIEKIEVEVEIP